MTSQPSLSEEKRLWAQGYSRVAGLDEAGRGAWAGPVVAAAVILPPESDALRERLSPVRDSKLLTQRQRDLCYDLVRQHALAYGVGAASAQEIDQLGIVAATQEAMQRALASIPTPADYLLIDALSLPRAAIPQRGIVKGDRLCLSVAAASILAKVTRDRWLVAMDERWPAYGLKRHKGYGTQEHRAALMALGPTPEHRFSYAPIRALCQAREAADV